MKVGLYIHTTLVVQAQLAALLAVGISYVVQICTVYIACKAAKRNRIYIVSFQNTHS